MDLRSTPAHIQRLLTTGDEARWWDGLTLDQQLDFVTRGYRQLNTIGMHLANRVVFYERSGGRLGLYPDSSFRHVRTALGLYRCNPDDVRASVFRTADIETAIRGRVA